MRFQSILLFTIGLHIGSYVLPMYTMAQSTQPTSQELRLEKRSLRKAQKQQKAYEKTLQKQLKNAQDSLTQVLEDQLNQIATTPIDSLKELIATPEQTLKQELTKTDQYNPDSYRDKLLIATPETDLFNEHKDKLQLLKADSATLTEAKTLAIEELNKTEQVKAIKEDIAPYIDSPYLKGIKLEDLDSMSVEDLQELRKQTFENLEEHYVKQMLERQEFIRLKQETAELEALKGLPEAYRKQFEAYKNGETIKNEALTKGMQEAQRLLAKHAPALNKAQADLAMLKKKYSSVPSSDDLSTATKRNSLKGKPLKSRLVLGGNFQIVTTNPVTIDISPVLGYRFTKDLHVAVGATYRARFSSADSTYIQTNYGRDELTYGYRAFANYTVWKAFFVHGEYERISKEFEVVGTDRFERTWKTGALIGIGSSYTIKGALRGSASLLYNFLHDDRQRVYQSPWVFRFGIGLALE